MSQRFGETTLKKSKRTSLSAYDSTNNNSRNLKFLYKGISRRDFTLFIPSLMVCASVPFDEVKSADRLKVVWHGLSFMGKCTEDCRNLDKAFPNIREILRDETAAEQIWRPVTAQIETVNSALPIEVLIPRGTETDVGQPDVGMVLAITSEADIASQYYANDDVTFLVYEIQCYGIVFDYKKFKVMNSFPIRLWRTDKVLGKKNDKSLKTWFFRALSGQGINDSTTLPDIFGKKLKNINFKKTDPISIRVTGVEVRRMMQKWLDSQNKTTVELKRIAGNSLTSAISETVNIGVQPFSVNKSLGDLAVTLSTSGAGAEIFNTLDLRDPDLDIRLVLRGVKITIKETNKKYFKNYRLTIGVQITIARYKYEFRTVDGVKKIIETPIEQVLKQKLRAITIEESTDQWRNDWYWVLDLHHALFEWFFSSVLDPNKIANMIRGYQRKGKTRKFFFQVHTKDKELFEKEVSQLRDLLLS